MSRSYSPPRRWSQSRAVPTEREIECTTVEPVPELRVLRGGK